MTCPKCHGVMRQYERSGVMVDQCTECRGVFLDRGELERLIDAEQAWHGSPPTQAERPRYREYDSGEYPRYGHTGRYGGQDKRKKRRSFLEDLFD